MDIKAMVDTLIFKLKDSDQSVRESSVRQMISLGEPAVEPLIQYLQHKDKWARLMAVAALGKMGDSRATEPLKEALKRLEIEGLIAIEPRSGTYVTDPDPVEIAASFDLRRVLEVYAVELLAQNATPSDLRELQDISDELRGLADVENRDTAYAHYLNLDHRFHRKLVALAKNTRLKEAHDRENVHSQMARIRYRCPARDINVPQQEHERLIAALLNRDVSLAQTIISAHLKRAKDSLLTDMGEAGDRRPAG